jgi:hypothetical protein
MPGRGYYITGPALDVLGRLCRDGAVLSCLARSERTTSKPERSYRLGAYEGDERAEAA